MSNMEKLMAAGEKCGIAIDEKQSRLMILYMEKLLVMNEKINVTRITDVDEFIEKHLIDSLTCLKFIHKDVKSILDVGTGGGFPGVPLAVMLPEAEITMTVSYTHLTLPTN